jgi:choline transport protein
VIVADGHCSSWWGSSSTLIFAFGSGGPVLLVYGFLFMALVAGCIAVSLGELASAYPNSGIVRTCRAKTDDAGGQYYWASRLAPKKYARFLSYTTGYLGWAGAVVVSGSVAVGLAQAVVGMIILANPNVSPLVKMY